MRNNDLHLLKRSDLRDLSLPQGYFSALNRTFIIELLGFKIRKSSVIRRKMNYKTPINGEAFL